MPQVLGGTTPQNAPTVGGNGCPNGCPGEAGGWTAPLALITVGVLLLLLATRK
jgi:hypothetical protein